MSSFNVSTNEISGVAHAGDDVSELRGSGVYGGIDTSLALRDVATALTTTSGGIARRYATHADLVAAAAEAALTHFGYLPQDISDFLPEIMDAVRPKPTPAEESAARAVFPGDLSEFRTVQRSVRMIVANAVVEKDGTAYLNLGKVKSHYGHAEASGSYTPIVVDLPKVLYGDSVLGLNTLLQRWSARRNGKNYATLRSHAQASGFRTLATRTGPELAFILNDVGSKGGRTRPSTGGGVLQVRPVAVNMQLPKGEVSRHLTKASRFRTDLLLRESTIANVTLDPVGIINRLAIGREAHVDATFYPAALERVLAILGDTVGPPEAMTPLLRGKLDKFLDMAWDKRISLGLPFVLPNNLTSRAALEQYQSDALVKMKDSLGEFWEGPMGPTEIAEFYNRLGEEYPLWRMQFVKGKSEYKETVEAEVDGNTCPVSSPATRVYFVAPAASRRLVQAADEAQRDCERTYADPLDPRHDCVQVGPQGMHRGNMDVLLAKLIQHTAYRNAEGRRPYADAHTGDDALFVVQVAGRLWVATLDASKWDTRIVASAVLPSFLHHLAEMSNSGAQGLLRSLLTLKYYQLFSSSPVLVGGPVVISGVDQIRSGQVGLTYANGVINAAFGRGVMERAMEDVQRDGSVDDESPDAEVTELFRAALMAGCEALREATGIQLTLEGLGVLRPPVEVPGAVRTPFTPLLTADGSPLEVVPGATFAGGNLVWYYDRDCYAVVGAPLERDRVLKALASLTIESEPDEFGEDEPQQQLAQVCHCLLLSTGGDPELYDAVQEVGQRLSLGVPNAPFAQLLGYATPADKSFLSGLLPRAAYTAHLIDAQGVRGVLAPDAATLPSTPKPLRAQPVDFLSGFGLDFPAAEPEAAAEVEQGPGYHTEPFTWDDIFRRTTTVLSKRVEDVVEPPRQASPVVPQPHTTAESRAAYRAAISQLGSSTVNVGSKRMEILRPIAAASVIPEKPDPVQGMRLSPGAVLAALSTISYGASEARIRRFFGGDAGKRLKVILAELEGARQVEVTSTDRGPLYSLPVTADLTTLVDSATLAMARAVAAGTHTALVAPSAGAMRLYKGQHGGPSIRPPDIVLQRTEAAAPAVGDGGGGGGGGRRTPRDRGSRGVRGGGQEDDDLHIAEAGDNLAVANSRVARGKRADAADEFASRYGGGGADE